MTFPKIEHPLFNVTIPSTKKSIKMRPMLVKEEKILLQAKEGKELNSIMLAVKQVVANCIVDASIDVGKLTIFDLDYLFLQLRAASVNSVVKLIYTDYDDKPSVLKRPGMQDESVYPQTEFEVDLSTVKVKFPEVDNRFIKMSETSGIKLKFPEVETYEAKEINDSKNEEELFENLIVHCFESYTENNTVHAFKDASREELESFIDNLDIPTYNKVVDFFSTMPTLSYEGKIKTKSGKEVDISLNKLVDFFTF